MNMASEVLSTPEEQALYPPLILIVDDSALIRKLIAVALQRAGFQVQGFADGVELLHALHDQKVRVPELILLDIGLPRMNGFQVAQALKKSERTQDCPIVIVSRRTGLLDHLRARLLGAYSWLDKPFTTQGLLAVVRAALHDTPSVRVARTSCLPILTTPATYPNTPSERQD